MLDAISVVIVDNCSVLMLSNATTENYRIRKNYNEEYKPIKKIII